MLLSIGVLYLTYVFWVATRQQMDRIEEKLQNLRQVDEQIVHHLEHDNENI